MPPPRMTIPTRQVLHALLDADELYGAEIGTECGLPSGTVHPILARLEGLAWVSSSWEDVDPVVAGRPARRYYRLTPDGRELAVDALRRARERRPTPRVVRPVAGGAS